MRRRTFIAVAAGAVLLPLLGRAQPRGMPLVGYLALTSPSPSAPWLAAFHRGLADTGYIEGQNLSIEYRWAEGRVDRLPALAAELVGRNVNVITTHGGVVTALAAKD